MLCFSLLSSLRNSPLFQFPIEEEKERRKKRVQKKISFLRPSCNVGVPSWGASALLRIRLLSPQLPRLMGCAACAHKLTGSPFCEFSSFCLPAAAGKMSKKFIFERNMSKKSLKCTPDPDKKKTNSGAESSNSRISNEWA